jgi:isopenicillin-N N-acyltransferase like protein
MRVFTIAGPGSQRGLEYGQEDAAAIAETAAAFKAQLAAAGHPPGPLGRRLTTCGLARTAAEVTPDLWAEVTSLAISSRVPLEDVLLLTFLDEVWALTGATPPIGHSGCSVVARLVAGTAGTPPTPGTTEIGQTMDLPAWSMGRMVVLRVGAVDAPTALVMSYPGSIGLCGANEAGLGVAVNALTHVPWSDDGLGVAFVVRHLLTMSTLADAAAFLSSVPHASGQAYTIAAPDGIGTFEADASRVRRVTEPGCATVAHTNHSLDNHSLDAEPSTDPAPTTSSLERLAVLRAAVEHREPLSSALTGDLILDGRRWGDPHVTMGAFRARGSEASARFIDATDIRAGRHDWSRITYV